MSELSTEPVVAQPKKASVLKVVRDQRKTLVVALCLAVAAYWIIGQLGEWWLAACLAIGVGLGLLNHLATEYWLLRVITSGEEPSRNRMIRSTVARLSLLSIVAGGATNLMVAPGGGGLSRPAPFRLIAPPS